MSESLVETLTRVISERAGQKAGAEIRFLCPAHDDHHPSARWHATKHTWYCDVCNASGGYLDLAKRLGIETQTQEPKEKRGIVASYDYVNEHGELLYQAVRFEPKRFSQRRPDGEGNWIWGLSAGWYRQKRKGWVRVPDADDPKAKPNISARWFDSVSIVLYHLGEVLHGVRNGRTVYIPEGEKDVDRLRELGLIATCNPMGAGKWRDGYSLALAGANLVVLPDNDPAGQAHAQQVARSLYGKAASIKVLNLPCLPAKGDVSDWLAAGGSVAELEGLVEATLEWTPDENSDREASQVEDSDPDAGQAARASDPEATADEKTERDSQATKLVRMVLAEVIELFHGSEGAGYATIAVQDHEETWSLNSKSFCNWLKYLYYTAEGKAPGAQAIKDALGILEAEALFKGPRHDVYVRLSPYENKFYLDLGDPNWRVVEIDSQGWRIKNRSPVKFRRPKSLAALPKPVEGGDLNELRRLLNVCDEDWPLVPGYLVGCLNPSIPYPALPLNGEHGSAKSTTARGCKKLVDPSLAPLRSAPRNEKDLMIAAMNSWILCFDNLSGIPNWLSDALCRLSTGAAHPAGSFIATPRRRFWMPSDRSS